MLLKSIVFRLLERCSFELFRLWCYHSFVQIVDHFSTLSEAARRLGYLAMKEARKLDVVLHSATGLKKVSTSKMSVYAVAWIEPSIRVPSPMYLKVYGTNPVWNTTISMPLDLRTLGHGMYLNIELLGHGLVSTRRIGFVSVNLSDIFLEGSKGAAVHSSFHACPVQPSELLLLCSCLSIH